MSKLVYIGLAFFMVGIVLAGLGIVLGIDAHLQLQRLTDATSNLDSMTRTVLSITEALGLTELGARREALERARLFWAGIGILGIPMMVIGGLCFESYKHKHSSLSSTVKKGQP